MFRYCTPLRHDRVAPVSTRAKGVVCFISTGIRAPLTPLKCILLMFISLIGGASPCPLAAPDCHCPSSHSSGSSASTSPRSSASESVGKFASSSSSCWVYEFSSSDCTSLTTAVGSGSVLMMGLPGTTTVLARGLPRGGRYSGSGPRLGGGRCTRPPSEPHSFPGWLGSVRQWCLSCRILGPYPLLISPLGR